ncbi:ACT domain-containing protein [Leeuwenhoekiella sp. MAR_2009_132]|uniref:ACT domain-containing protein n=1 Tax=Leeuwenhoekiella sp. MAR_2009_132 TaxID=1392489 RepID=UPI00048B2393|nr:ACT domain-containing protein [Leeuwenhoekiella sp. MAR_2009_132]
MTGEKNLKKLIKGMKPKLNTGTFIFCSVGDLNAINRNETLFEFKEPEGITIVLEQAKADALHLNYSYCSSWITLEIYSSLEAVGLTAAFSTALARAQISCNVIAGYYHDHIFVAQEDAEKAMNVLKALSNT